MAQAARTAAQCHRGGPCWQGDPLLPRAADELSSDTGDEAFPHPRSHHSTRGQSAAGGAGPKAPRAPAPAALLPPQLPVDHRVPSQSSPQLTAAIHVPSTPPRASEGTRGIPQRGISGEGSPWQQGRRSGMPGAGSPGERRPRRSRCGRTATAPQRDPAGEGGLGGSSGQRPAATASLGRPGGPIPEELPSRRAFTARRAKQEAGTDGRTDGRMDGTG